MTVPRTPSAPPVGAQRRLPLEGAVNFRDLGGYRTADGRRIKWKHLYRSDSLADLTAADIEIVASLGLKTLLDLRHASERQRKPNCALPEPAPQTHAIGFLPYLNPELFAAIIAGEMTVGKLYDWCLVAYRRFLPEPTFARVLERLLAPGAFPALIHCTSGKDRTGFAAAVVMMALGVPQETIIEDFLMTNQHRRDIRYLMGDNVDPEVAHHLTRVRPDYLEVCFEAIDAIWGGAEAYLAHALGLDEARRLRLQELLLEADA